jgi:hypothetical protein
VVKSDEEYGLFRWFDWLSRYLYRFAEWICIKHYSISCATTRALGYAHYATSFFSITVKGLKLYSYVLFLYSGVRRHLFTPLFSCYLPLCLLVWGNGETAICDMSSCVHEWRRRHRAVSLV